MSEGFKNEQLNDLFNDLPLFTASLNKLAERLSLNLQPLQPDHIAVRCHQISTAERWERGLLSCARLLSKKLINGRPIALFQLNSPLKINHWQISVVELPWPGQKLYRHEGWEHVEFVLPGDAETLGVRAMALFSDESLLQSGISFKTSAPKGEGERLPNPTLAVTDGEVTLKFHPWSITEIIASEAEQGG